jgi:hypothetical protein
VSRRALRTGDVIDLLPDETDDDVVTVTVGESLGFAELRIVTDATGRMGMLALKRDGSWWWVRELAWVPEDGEG